jgi:hypothetical protein
VSELNGGVDLTRSFTAIAVENVEVFDFEVIVHIAGQLHRQVRDMPPGTRITGFEMAPEPPP